MRQAVLLKHVSLGKAEQLVTTRVHTVDWPNSLIELTLCNACKRHRRGAGCRNVANRIANLEIDLLKAENDLNYECLAHINKASQLRISVTKPPGPQTQPWYHQLAEATADPNKTPLNENEKQVAKNKTLCTNAAEPEDAKATFDIRYATVQQTGRMCMSLKRYIRRKNANRYDTVQERCRIGDEMV